MTGTRTRVETGVLAAVAATLAGWSLVDAALHDWWGAPGAAGAVLIVAGTGPLALLRRTPVGAALAVNLVALVFGFAWGTPNTAPPFLALLAATFATAAFTPRRLLLWAALGSCVLAVQLLDRVEHDTADVVWVLGTWAVTLVVGLLVFEREDHEERDRASAASTRQEARTAADHALTLERARIARDLLDVVTRSVDVMIAETAAGRTESLGGRQEMAAAALDRVESTGQGALAELRRMLDVMRGSVEPSTEPQPGLEALEQLLERLSAGGWPARGDVHGRIDRVPSGVGVAAYRIVQDALDEVRRCAPDAEVDVDVTVGREELVVEVRDTGSTTGRGGAALAHRVEVYGGRLDAGPLDPGWQVRVVLPW